MSRIDVVSKEKYEKKKHANNLPEKSSAHCARRHTLSEVNLECSVTKKRLEKTNRSHFLTDKWTRTRYKARCRIKIRNAKRIYRWITRCVFELYVTLSCRYVFFRSWTFAENIYPIFCFTSDFRRKLRIRQFAVSSKKKYIYIYRIHVTDNEFQRRLTTSFK